jgi:Lar family restriction alleviation protein
MIPSLKPCPFCNGEAKIIKATDFDGITKWHKVYCINCQNRTWQHPIRRKAIEAWNTRANEETKHYK